MISEFENSQSHQSCSDYFMV